MIISVLRTSVAFLGIASVGGFAKFYVSPAFRRHISGFALPNVQFSGGGTPSAYRIVIRLFKHVDYECSLGLRHVLMLDYP
jgi:hypothetical protein